MAHHPVCNDEHKHRVGNTFDKLYKKIRSPEEHPCAICQGRRIDLSEKQKRNIARKIAFSWIYGNQDQKSSKMISIGAEDENPQDTKKKRKAKEGKITLEKMKKLEQEEFDAIWKNTLDEKMAMEEWEEGANLLLDENAKIAFIKKMNDKYLLEKIIEQNEKDLYVPPNVIEILKADIELQGKLFWESGPQPIVPGPLWQSQSPLELLPDDILSLIVKFISDPRSILNFGMTSKKYYEIIKADFARQLLFDLMVKKTFTLENPAQIKLNVMRNFLKTMAFLDINDTNDVLYVHAKKILDEIIERYSPSNKPQEEYLYVVLHQSSTFVENMLDNILKETSLPPQMQPLFKDYNPFGIYFWRVKTTTGLEYNISWAEACVLSHNKTLYNALRNRIPKPSFFSWIFSHDYGPYHFILSLMFVYHLDEEFYESIWKDMISHADVAAYIVPIEKLMIFYFDTGIEDFFVGILEWMPLSMHRKYILGEPEATNTALIRINEEIKKAQKRYGPNNEKTITMIERKEFIKKVIEEREKTFENKRIEENLERPPTTKKYPTRQRKKEIKKYYKNLFEK